MFVFIERNEEWEMRKKNDPTHETSEKEPDPVVRIQFHKKLLYKIEINKEYLLNEGNKRGKWICRLPEGPVIDFFFLLYHEYFIS